MNERRRILHDNSGADVVTLRVTTTDGSTNVGIEMVVTNGNNVYSVTTDSQGKVEMTGLSGGCTIDCETYEISVHEFIATGTMTVDISAYVNSFPVGETRSFNYTGAVSEVQLIPGSYKLQVWGAQGGSNAAASSYGITAKAGGKGGYSEGIITLSSKTTVLVYVGGQGSSSAGGFNGGGSTTGSSTYNASNEQGVSRMGGGGGASDIRLSDGALLSRMIVAGGGAGGAMCYKKDSSVTYESGYKYFANYSGSKNSDFGDSLIASFSSMFQVSTKIAVTSSLSINNVTSPNSGSPCCLVFNSSGSLIKIFIARTASTQSGAYVMNITYNDVKDGSYIRICNDVRNPISTSMSITYISGYNYFKNWVSGASGNEISSWTDTFQVSTKITVTSSLTVNKATSANDSSPCCILYNSSGSMIGALFARTASTYSGAYVRNIAYNDIRSASYIRICNDTRNPAEVINSTSTDSQVGGVGGGTQGGAYSSTYAGKQNAAGSGGSFGQGANMTTTNYRYCSGAGGGGWYGGGTTYSDSGTTSCKYGGGGSGFVNTAASAGNRPSGYTGLELDSGETKAGNTSFPSISGGTETGHSGNGYAKITRFAICTITLIVKDEDNLPVEGASLTVSNSENTYSLTTDSNGEATANMINGTYNVVCSGYSLTPSQITVSSNATIDIVAATPSIMDFSYTGAVQNATLRAGTYKIECWGAQGGYRSSSTYGGKGGYSVGVLTLLQNTNIYIYVGGAGNTGGTSGGFNGGGMRATYAGGGGGSDVRIGTDSLYARVIVAGGGGSDGATSKQGMYGGGTAGGTTTESFGTGGGGGTQTSGGTGSSSASGSGTSGTYGAFGVGGRGYAASSGYAGAGGGGWYGGAGSYPDGSGDDDRGGGGGSGYVYNSSTASSYPSGCLLNSSHYLANSQTIAGNTSMPSTSGGTETGHSGNGFVRITKM